MARVSHDYWIIRHPTSQGAIVAKFKTAGGRDIPADVANYDGFKIVSVPSESGLTDKTVDHSDLTQDEIELLSKVYDIR